MKHKIVIRPTKVKVRKQLPSELVVTRIHDSEKDHRRKKVRLTNLKPEDIDEYDDRFYE